MAYNIVKVKKSAKNFWPKCFIVLISLNKLFENLISFQRFPFRSSFISPLNFESKSFSQLFLGATHKCGFLPYKN